MIVHRSQDTEIPNIEKSNTDFDVWLKESVIVSAQGDYKKKNYIPDVDLRFTNFNTFIAEREALLIEALGKELRL